MRAIRVSLLTEIMAPHRIPLFNALAADPAIDLTVVFAAVSDASRRWGTHEDEMRFHRVVLRERAVIRRGGSFVHVSTGLLSALRRSRPDVVIAGGWEQPSHLEAYALRRRLGYRFAWWVESTRRDHRSSGERLDRSKRRLLAGSDGVIVPGVASADHVRSLGTPPGRTWVAPNAVDNERFARAASSREGHEGPVRFLFVGRLEPSKGVPTLLDAWVGMPPHAELSLVGDGSLSPVLGQRILRQGGPLVHLVGHRDRDELSRLYAEADVFVFPSVSDPWGLVLNEAMASGLPVVTTPAPGSVDDLVRDGENGFVVPPRRPGPLGDAMRALLDPGLRREMGARSAQRIVGYSSEAWARGMRDAALALAGDR